MSDASSSLVIDHRKLVKLNHHRLEEIYEVCHLTAPRPPITTLGIKVLSQKGIFGDVDPRARSDNGILGEGLFAKVYRVRHRKVSY